MSEEGRKGGVMNSREHSIATWCKRFQIEMSILRDRMKAGELVVYEKTGDEEVNVTPLAITKIKELIADIQQTLMDE